MTNAATDYLNIVINAATSTTGLVITDDDRVGIGTTTPTKKLEVYEDNSATTTTTGIQITNPSTTTNSRSGIVFKNYDNNGAAIWSPRTGSSSGYLIFGTNSGAGIAETNIAEGMRLDNNGRLGIGSTNPASKLHVSGNLSVYNSQSGSESVAIDFYPAYSGSIPAYGIGMGPTASEGYITYRSGTSSTSVYGHKFYINNVEMMRIRGDGTIGIGTSAPDDKLDVEGDAIFGASGFDTGAVVDIGSAGTDYQGNSGWPGTWNSNILLSGSDYSTISWHDSGLSVGALGYHANMFFFDGAGSWGPVKLGINQRSPGAALEISDASTGYAGEVGSVRIVNSADTTEKVVLGFDNSLGTYGSGYIGSVKSGTTWLPFLIAPAGGNVGVAGITAPDERLQVYGTSAGEGAHIGEAYLGIWDGGTGYAVFTHNSVKTTSGSYAVLQQSNGATYLNTASGQNMYFRENNLDRMMLEASTGDFGIGTTSPALRLHVVKDEGANWLSRFENTNSGGSSVYLAHGGGFGAYIDAGTDASSTTYALNVNKAGTSYLYVRGDGPIGIATATPNGEYPLTIYSSSTSNKDMIFFNKSGYTWDIGMPSNSGHQTNFWIGDGVGIVPFVINRSTGYVGISTTTPAKELQVYGTVRVGKTGTTGCIEDGDGTNIMGTCDSDINLKTNITYLNNSLQKITQLKPATFQWTKETQQKQTRGNDKEYGLIAQETEKILPELVTTTNTNRRTEEEGLVD
jgi:hypothetical protein